LDGSSASPVRRTGYVSHEAKGFFVVSFRPWTFDTGWKPLLCYINGCAVEVVADWTPFRHLQPLPHD